MDANPKNAKNPTTSVTVVRSTELAIAGSAPTFFRNSGIDAPKNPATNKFITIAIPITNPNLPLSNHKKAIIPIKTAKNNPFSKDTIISRLDEIKLNLKNR